MYGQSSHIKASTTANRPQQPHRTGEAWRKPLQTLPSADKENENPQRSSSAGGMRTPASCSSSSSFLPMIGGPSLMFSADYSLFPSSQPPVRASSSNRSYAEASRGPKITLADDEDEELLRLGDVSFDNSDAEGGDVSQHPSHAVEGGAEMNVKSEEQKEREKEEKAKYNRMVDELILDFFNKRDIGTTGKCPSWSVLCADIQNEISQKTGTVLPEQWLKSRIGTILVQSGSYVQKKYWETLKLGQKKRYAQLYKSDLPSEGWKQMGPSSNTKTYPRSQRPSTKEAEDIDTKIMLNEERHNLKRERIRLREERKIIDEERAIMDREKKQFGEERAYLERERKHLNEMRAVFERERNGQCASSCSCNCPAALRGELGAMMSILQELKGGGFHNQYQQHQLPPSTSSSGGSGGSGMSAYLSQSNTVEAYLEEREIERRRRLAFPSPIQPPQPSRDFLSFYHTASNNNNTARDGENSRPS
ncbi:hypothetical protein QOT17_014127 [Balamuthia mandrillaris]